MNNTDEIYELIATPEEGLIIYTSDDVHPDFVIKTQNNAFVTMSIPVIMIYQEQKKTPEMTLLNVAKRTVNQLNMGEHYYDLLVDEKEYLPAIMHSSLRAIVNPTANTIDVSSWRVAKETDTYMDVMQLLESKKTVSPNVLVGTPEDPNDPDEYINNFDVLNLDTFYGFASYTCTNINKTIQSGDNPANIITLQNRPRDLSGDVFLN